MKRIEAHARFMAATREVMLSTKPWPERKAQLDRARAQLREWSAGYKAGEAAAYMDTIGCADAGSSADFACGFEDGYDANFERADRIRAAFGCEE